MLTGPGSLLALLKAVSQLGDTTQQMGLAQLFTTVNTHSNPSLNTRATHSDNQERDEIPTRLDEVDLEGVSIHFLSTYSTHPNWKQIVSACNGFGQTLAHISIALGYFRLLQHLFGWQIDLTLVDGMGSTALHYAYLFKQEECAKFLIHSGVDQFILDDLGRSPSDLDPSLEVRLHSIMEIDNGSADSASPNQYDTEMPDEARKLYAKEFLIQQWMQQGEDERMGEVPLSRCQSQENRGATDDRFSSLGVRTPKERPTPAVAEEMDLGASIEIATPPQVIYPPSPISEVSPQTQEANRASDTGQNLFSHLVPLGSGMKILEPLHGSRVFQPLARSSSDSDDKKPPPPLLSPRLDPPASAHPSIAALLPTPPVSGHEASATFGASATACNNCGTTVTPLWRRDQEGKSICNACGFYLKIYHVSRPSNREPLPVSITSQGHLLSGTSGDIKEQNDVTGAIIRQALDFVPNCESFCHQLPWGWNLPSFLLQFMTPNLADIVGPSFQSHAPALGGSLPKRLKASLNAVNLPAKRWRREPPHATGNTTQDDSMDEYLGFVSLGQQPEVQKAMRDLVAAIRTSQFFRNEQLEPNLGTLEAAGLLAGASNGHLNGYGTKAKSIYSLFIKVHGKEYMCLWCGDVQKGKLQRTIDHFRAKHLGHEPFLCDDIHVDNEVW